MSTRSLIPSLLTDSNDKDLFQDLHSEVDRIFRQFRAYEPRGYDAPSNAITSGKSIPKINVAETDDEYEVEVELPGVSQENVDVSVLNQSLVIEGHSNIESKKKGHKYRIVERSEGSFKRVIPIGFEVKDKDIVANVKDGVLKIILKKPVELSQSAKKIKIEKAGPA